MWAGVIIAGVNVARSGRPDVEPTPDEAADLIRSSNPDGVPQ